MKIYYCTKKNIIGGLVFLLLIGGFLSISLLYFSDAGVASKAREPVYQGNTGKKVAAITVNVDWGEEYIPGMLEVFKKYDAKVTFFVTGQWAEKNPELLKKMHKAGDNIQNHGYKHLHFNSISSSEANNQIKKAEEVINKIVDQKTSYFAPPYGEYNKQLLTVTSDMNYYLIMWSVDTIDWQKPAPETIIKRVVNKVHNDAIILMHPTDPTLKALPGMLDQLKAEGYKMVTIDKILVDKDENEGKHEVE